MIKKTQDGTAIINRDRPWETAEWFCEIQFNHYRLKWGRWWVNCATGEEPADWVETEEQDLRATVWNVLSGQAMPRVAGESDSKQFHPRKADVDEIMDALRAYLWDSEGELTGEADTPSTAENPRARGG